MGYENNQGTRAYSSEIAPDFFLLLTYSLAFQ